MCSGLENSDIRVAVGDCSVTEHRRWRPPYQTGKTVHMHTTNTINVVTRTGFQQQRRHIYDIIFCLILGKGVEKHQEMAMKWFR